MFILSRIKKSIGLKSLFYFGIPSLIMFIVFTQVAHSYVRKTAERDYQRNALNVVKVIKSIVDPKEITDPEKFKTITDKIVKDSLDITKIDIHIRGGVDDIVFVSTDGERKVVDTIEFVSLFEKSEEMIERRGKTILLSSPVYQDTKPVAMIRIYMSTVEEQARIADLISRLIIIGIIGAFIMGLIMYATFKRVILNPIANMERSTRKLAVGDYEEVKIDRSDEIGRLAKHFNRVLDILKIRDEENKELYKKLETSYHQARSEAITDDLTKLFNYRHFRSRFSQELNRVTRKKTPISLAFIDIDNFKDYNDKFGHQAGDKALLIVAEIITNQIRSSDIAARYGGEELVVILPDTSIKMAYIISDRIRTEIKNKTLKDADRQLSVSIGLSVFPEDGTTDEELIKWADKSMYEAKKLGKDRVVALGHKGFSHLSHDKMRF